MKIRSAIFTLFTSIVLVTIFTLSGFILTSIHATPVDMANIGTALAYAQVPPVTCSVTNGGPSIAVGYGGSTDPLTVDLGLSFGQTDITPTNATANFGDGSTTVASITKTRLGDIQIEHTYEKSGNYSISITVYGSEYNPDNIPNIVHTQETCQVSVSEPVIPNPTGPPSIAIKTDKTSYNYGEPVTVSGNITNAIPSGSGSTNNLFITISGQGSTGQIGPITMNPDGSFSQVIQPTSFVSGAGSYTIIAQYGGYTSTSQTFYYPSSTQQTTPTTPTTSPAPILITVTTDQTAYNYGDLVTISGKVTNAIPSTNGGPVNQLYIIINKVDSNAQGLIGPIPINSDGRFSQVVHPGSFVSGASGSYTVTAQYGYGGFVNGQISSGQTFSGSTFYYPNSNNPSVTTSQQTTQQNATQQTTSSIPSTSPVAGITVTTDKTSYIKRDPIVISGTVSTSVPNGSVTIIIKNPAGQAVSITQAQVGSNGIFSTTVTPTDNELWQSGGTYSVLVQYNGAVVATAQTTFQFSGVTGQFTISPPVATSTPNTSTSSTQSTSSQQTTTSSTSSSTTQNTIPPSTTATTSSTPTTPTTTSIHTTTTTTSTTPQQNTTHAIATQQTTQQSTPMQQIPQTLQEPKFPAWFNNVIIWYEQGKISNEDLFNAIQFLHHS